MFVMFLNKKDSELKNIEHLNLNQIISLQKVPVILFHCYSMVLQKCYFSYLFKVSNENIRTITEICSKLIINTPERRQ